MNARTATAALLAMGVSGSVASASSSYSYLTDQATYVYTGSPVTVQVSLLETNTDSVSQLVSQLGLIGFDVSLSRSSGSGMITAALANTAAFSSALSPVYSPATIPLSGVTSSDFAVSALDAVGPSGTAEGNNRRLLLGTFTIDGPGSFSVANSAMGTNTVTVLDTLALDTQIAAATFTIVVPEPTSLGAVALLAGGLLRRRRA